VNAPLRVAVYARVSTERQRDRHTIDSQLRLLPEHARRQGWRLVETYVDDGISGKTIEARPSFQRLLADAEAGRFDIVLSIEASRIVRPDERIQSALIHDHLRRCGVRLATPEGIIDLRSDDQALVAEIQHAVAGWERRKIVSRMMRGKREAARKGRRFSSLDPYGFRWVPADIPNGGSYQIVPEEAVVVKRMFALALDGLVGRIERGLMKWQPRLGETEKL
jgi:site-specific DNA recombinase